MEVQMFEWELTPKMVRCFFFFFYFFVSPPPNFIPLERILLSPVLALFRGDPTINAYE